MQPTDAGRGELLHVQPLMPPAQLLWDAHVQCSCAAASSWANTHTAAVLPTRLCTLCCCSYLRHRDALVVLAYLACACWQLWHANLGGNIADSAQQPGVVPSAGRALQLLGALSPAFLALACQVSSAFCVQFQATDARAADAQFLSWPPCLPPP